MLYIVATPLGNLEDITLRALRILKECRAVICEDTRVSSPLLKHFGIEKELISMNARSELKKAEYIMQRLKSGEDLALISDAGTPGISDPGGILVNLALKEEIEVVPVPGPSAVITALSASGLPSSSYIFDGFLPQKKGRQKKLKQLAEEERTIVLYESVYRIEKLLTELNEYMPERLVTVYRELTKKFEERWAGTASELLRQLPSKTIKGEFVVILAPKNWKHDALPEPDEE